MYVHQNKLSRGKNCIGSTVCWSRGDDIFKILNLMYNAPESIRMNRKYNRKQIVTDICMMPLKERLYYLMSVKIHETVHEIENSEKMIISTCKAAEQGTKSFDGYNFRGTWLKYLHMFALDDNGKLYDDWQQRNISWICRFRHNELYLSKNVVAEI